MPLKEDQGAGSVCRVPETLQAKSLAHPLAESRQVGPGAFDNKSEFWAVHKETWLEPPLQPEHYNFFRIKNLSAFTSPNHSLGPPAFKKKWIGR